MAAESNNIDTYIGHLQDVSDVFHITKKAINPSDQSNTITIVTKTLSITRKEAMDNWDDWEEKFIKVEEQTKIDDDTIINFHSIKSMDLDYAYNVYIHQEDISEDNIKRILFKYKYREYYKKSYDLHFLVSQFNEALEDIRDGIYNAEKYIPMRLFLDPMDYPIFSKTQDDLIAKLKIYKGFHCRIRPSSFNGFDFNIENYKLMNSYYVVQGLVINEDGTYKLKKNLYEKIFSIGYFNVIGSYTNDVLQKQTTEVETCFCWFDILMNGIQGYII